MAKKIIVKCLYCGESFDRNNPDIPFVQRGRRYAHTKCAEEYDNSLTQEQKDLNSLIEYIKKLLGEDYNFMKVKKQIEDYHKKYDYSYSGMLRSLIWFYEVKQNSIISKEFYAVHHTLSKCSKCQLIENSYQKYYLLIVNKQHINHIIY